MSNRSLEEFVEEVNGTSHLRIEYDYGDGFVRLRTSEAERRQAAQDIRSSEDILIELLRNARDAHAAHIFVAVSKSGAKRSITVIDDGDGIPAAMHSLIFEPRVTSKLDTAHIDKWGMHGRGMALYSVAQNAREAKVVSSVPSAGSAIQVISDTSVLSEKADQSSFPTFILNERGTVDVRGPKNLVRTACEFAIEERAACSVYIGSATEILAAIYAVGAESMSAVDRLFCDNPDMLPFPKRLATANEPNTFAKMAGSMGLELSERSARRILDGTIDPAEPLLSRITVQDMAKPKGKRKAGVSSSQTRLKLSKNERTQLAEDAKQAFAPIAERYYLESEIEPTVKAGTDRITISIPIVRK